MGARVELAGQRFGRLIVLSESNQRDPSGNIRWNCVCDCGTFKVVSSQGLKNGSTRSCGCLFMEVAAEKGRRKRVHGMTDSREYRSWCGLKDRCDNKNSPKYPAYGGRGIRYCERWVDFSAFLEDMGLAPAGMTLDRIDVNGDYEPKNCRWATQQEQQNNRRDNVWLEMLGKRQTVSQWCAAYGLRTNSVWTRAKKNGGDFRAAVLDEADYRGKR